MKRIDARSVLLHTFNHTLSNMSKRPAPAAAASTQSKKSTHVALLPVIVKAAFKDLRDEEGYPDMPKDLLGMITDYLLTPSALQLMAADPDAPLVEGLHDTLTARTREALEDVFHAYATAGIPEQRLFTKENYCTLSRDCKCPNYVLAVSVDIDKWRDITAARTKVDAALAIAFGKHGAVWTKEAFLEFQRETCTNMHVEVVRDMFRRIAPLLYDFIL